MDNELVRVLVNGKWYEVEIGEITSAPFEVIVNGNVYVVQFDTCTEPGSKIQAEQAQAAPNVPAKTVSYQPAGTTNGSGGKEIHSPMPGVILEISVEPGEDIKTGQVLCYLEAMKMKNAIRSPQDGKIEAIQVVEGQKVAYNDLLIRLE